MQVIGVYVCRLFCCVCVLFTPFAVSGDSYEEEEEDELDCPAPTPKRCKLARERALKASPLWALSDIWRDSRSIPRHPSKRQQCVGVFVSLANQSL